MENTQDEIARLLARIAALEAELARYAVKYGMTDEARRLLVAMMDEKVTSQAKTAVVVRSA